VLCALVLVVLLALLPERTYGDDAFFVLCIVRERAFTAHFLFLPLARAAARVAAAFGADPFLALRCLSALGTAAGVALLAAAAARRGASRRVAVALALLVLSANSTWFFAGAAEVHGLQLGALALLAWVLSGFRPASAPWRSLALALAFGVAVGAHKSSGLFLPGVLSAYALATPGRPRALRARDAALFALGGALSVAAQSSFVAHATGSVSSGDNQLFTLANLRGSLQNLAPVKLFPFLAEAYVAPAFAPVVLGAAGAAGLLRRRPLLGLTLASVLLPHVVFFALFGWAERGAYAIVLLPLLVWSAARAAAGSGAPQSAAQKLFTVLVAGLALAGSLATRAELAALLGTRGLLLLPALAFAGGLFLTRHAWLSASRTGLFALALAACQLAGSQRELRAWDRGDPLLAWGRDAVHATGADAVLIATGYERYCLLLLLDRPWPEPFTDTWSFARELGDRGPTAFDAGAVAPELAEGVARFLAEGRRVFVLDTVFEAFEDEPLRGPHVRALKQRFELIPIEHGAFRGYELR
jgi:hypothetical protein